MGLSLTENGNDNNKSREISESANENETSVGKSKHSCSAGKGGARDGAIKETDETWDELCIGFWSQSCLGRNDCSPGHCQGINILRAESEAELEQMKNNHSTGIRIIFISSRDEAPHSPLRSGRSSQIETGESKPLSGRITLQKLLTEKAKEGFGLALTLANDAEYKKKVQADLAVTLQQEMRLLRRIADKMTSTELAWRVLHSAQHTVTSGLTQAVDWLKGNGSAGNT